MQGVLTPPTPSPSVHAEPDVPVGIIMALGDAENLRSLGSVVMNVLRIIDNPESDCDGIERALQSDVALSTRLLRFVNSAYFGLARKVTRVRDAITLLGLVRVRSIVLSTSFLGAMSRETPQAEMLWSHSVAVGTMARLIAGAHRRFDTEQAFLAGVLHDLGKALLLQAFGTQYAEVCDAATIRDWDFSAVELEVFDSTHADVGAVMASKWGFGSALVLPIRYHHDDEILTSETVTDYERGLVATVRLADEVWNAHRLADGSLSPDPLPVASIACDALGMSPSDVEWLWEPFLELYSEAKRLLA